jgi:hypothetical protein
MDYPKSVSNFDGWSKEKLLVALENNEREYEGLQQQYQAKIEKYLAIREAIQKELAKHGEE